MAADQAAGLRRYVGALRRGERQPLRGVTCFSDSVDSSVRLAHALHQIGRVTLLADTQGRLFADCSPRSLFDWKQQLVRRQLHTLPQPYGEGWYARGVRADDPAVSGMANGYDHVIFDAGWGGDLALPPGAAHTVVMEIHSAGESMRHAYAVLKTLARSGRAVSVGMLGDPTACDRVRAAACRFLELEFAHAIFSAAHADDAFAALAVRMAGEETGLTAC